MEMDGLSKKKTNEEFVKEVYDLVKDEYEFLEEYQDAKTKILTRHNKCENEYFVKPNEFLRGSRCPRCSVNSKKTNENFLKEVYKLVGNNYEFLEEYKDGNTPILCKHNCKECHYREYKVAPSSFLRGTRCSKCKTRKKSQKQFEEEVFDLVKDEYRVLSNYISANEKIKIKHNICGIEYEVTPSGFINLGARCVKCGNTKRNSLKTKSHEKFEKEVFNISGNEYKILEHYKKSGLPILMRHNKCNTEYKVSPNSFLRGRRCPNCFGKKMKNNKQIDEEVFRVNKEVERIGSYVNAKTKIKYRHTVCGHEWEVLPNHLLEGKSCPRCRISKGEKMICKVLSNYNVKFRTQERFGGCRYKKVLPFDFSVLGINKDIKLLIEFDGSQHFEPVTFGAVSEEKAKSNFKLQQIKDNIKTNYCKENNIPLLRIPYWDYDNIESILEKELVKYGLINVDIDK